MITQLDAGIDIFLQPGEWYFGGAGTSIRTTLGSCIAVTLWHPRHRNGGMCHFMLPGRSKRGDRRDTRYAENAVERLLVEAGKCPGRVQDYQIKLFGGASMFETRAGEDSVPVRNIRAARELMLAHGLRIKAHHLGGNCYRELIFRLSDGDVWMRLGRGFAAGNCSMESA